MKLPVALLTSLLTLACSSVMAHAGPASLTDHLVEHLALALLIGLPSGYALLRLAAAAIKQHRTG